MTLSYLLTDCTLKHVVRKRGPRKQWFFFLFKNNKLYTKPENTSAWIHLDDSYTSAGADPGFEEGGFG